MKGRKNAKTKTIKATPAPPKIKEVHVFILQNNLKMKYDNPPKNRKISDCGFLALKTWLWILEIVQSLDFFSFMNTLKQKAYIKN